MRKADAIKHYTTEQGVANALGITRQAVSKWPDVIPPQRAIELEMISKGALRVMPKLYAKAKKHN
jgi:transcriptional repressor of cell division inhibition gene dicB